MTVEPSPLAAPAPVADCFYVYPTVSLDPGVNSDLQPGEEEVRTVVGQFARFRTACRTFAPLYRQMTLTALARRRADGRGAARWRPGLCRRARRLPRLPRRTTTTAGPSCW